jgi:hypothetical protein
MSDVMAAFSQMGVTAKSNSFANAMKLKVFVGITAEDPRETNW